MTLLELRRKSRHSLIPLFSPSKPGPRWHREEAVGCLEAVGWRLLAPFLAWGSFHQVAMGREHWALSPDVWIRVLLCQQLLIFPRVSGPFWGSVLYNAGPWVR